MKVRKVRKFLCRFGAMSVLCMFVMITFAQPVFAAGTEDDIVGYVPCALDGGVTALSDETSLGRAVADALCYVSGAQIAIVNGGDLSTGLAIGTYSYGEIQSAFSENRQIAVAQVTPKELCAILEAGVSHITVDPETSLIKRGQSVFWGFPQVSGFWFQYDAAGPVGERIMHIRLDGEDELDLTDETRLITVAATSYMFFGAYSFPEMKAVSPLNMTLSEALAEYIASGENTDMGAGNNMSVAGSRDEPLISLVPKWVLPVVLLALIIGACSGKRIKKLSNVQSYEDSHNKWMQ